MKDSHYIWIWLELITTVLSGERGRDKERERERLVIIYLTLLLLGLGKSYVVYRFELFPPFAKVDADTIFKFTGLFLKECQILQVQTTT